MRFQAAVPGESANGTTKPAKTHIRVIFEHRLRTVILTSSSSHCPPGYMSENQCYCHRRNPNHFCHSTIGHAPSPQPTIRLTAEGQGEIYSVCVCLAQTRRRQYVRPSADRPKQRPLRITRKPAPGDISVQGHFVALAALLVQANPQAAIGPKIWTGLSQK
jgi:hypothetical protein